LFELAQAIGGGKTHLMAALGLLARHPSQRSEVLPQDVLGQIDDQSTPVAVFDGRNSPDRNLWETLPTNSDAVRSGSLSGNTAPARPARMTGWC